MANPLEDTPPGAPPYAAGPLANQRPPSAGAVLASGQSPDSYFAPKGIPVVRAANATSTDTGLGSIARGLLDRAASGFSSLFGGAPAVAQAPVLGASAAPTIAARTGQLESGLNALEARSTGFRQSPNIVTAPVATNSPNIAVAANSAANEYNADFEKRNSQTLTPTQFNALSGAQQRAFEANKNLPVGQQQDVPTFYQRMLAGTK